MIGGPETAEDMVWYQVDFDGVQGWVSRSYLAIPVAGDDATVTDALDPATPLATDNTI